MSICADCSKSTEEDLKLCRDLLTGMVNELRQRDLMHIRLEPLDNLTIHKSKRCSVSAIACQSNGNIFVTDRINSKLIIFSSHGDLLSQNKLPRSVWDICVIEIADIESLVLTCPWSKTMTFVDISDPTKIKVQRHVYFNDYIFGVQPYNDSRIVSVSKARCVFYHLFYDIGKPDTIRMITQDGDILWSVDTNQHDLKLCQNVSDFTYITGIRDETSIIFVVDCGNETVTAFSTDGGTLIQQIKMHGKGPRGITMDNVGHVYVCCSKTKEVVVLTRDLHVSRTVISKCAATPEAIEYNSIRHELVLSCEHRKRSSIERFAC